MWSRHSVASPKCRCCKDERGCFLSESRDESPSVQDVSEVNGLTQPSAETGKHDLRKLAPKMARTRRRQLRAELSFRRNGSRVQVTLERATTTIGRDLSCDVVLEDEATSRRHARIAKSDEGLLELCDLGSTNGTWVRDVRVDRFVLCHGDKFTVGDTRFTIEVFDA